MTWHGVELVGELGATPIEGPDHERHS